jgi:fibronectin type 3 domain-containing protein
MVNGRARFQYQEKGSASGYYGIQVQKGDDIKYYLTGAAAEKYKKGLVHGDNDSESSKVDAG